MNVWGVIFVAVIGAAHERTVNRVIDGDTIRLSGIPRAVRVYGIDAPEKAQTKGSEAAAFASKLMLGKKVMVERKSLDRYGRTIATVRLPDGRDLSEVMVSSGWAWHYRAYSKDKGLAAVEQMAREAKVGVWSDPAPIAPWDWRKNKKGAKP